MSDRPNILYIFTDQQAADAMSCAGNPDLYTPAMDSLAASGIRFDQAYCTYPLCTPSRASMFTGLYPHQIGITDNHQAMTAEAVPKGLGHVLSTAGYECVYAGKWHVPEISIPEGHGFKQICRFSDWEAADRCVEFINKPHDKPFFLVASLDNPHNICEYSRQTALPWGPVPTATLEECPDLPANYDISPHAPEALQAEKEKCFPIFRGKSFTPEDWQQYRHTYFRLVEKVDAEIGKILEALRVAGLEEDTLVIFSSDHGDGNGAHQWNQKWTLYEESVRVPFIISYKGRTMAGKVDTEHLVSNGLDLFPTICGYAGVDVPVNLPGKSLWPFIEGNKPDAWREYLMAETVFGPCIHGLGTQGRMVRSEKYKYVIYSWGKYREQLYDLETDPGEMKNLAIEEQYQELVNEHRVMLKKWMEETRDQFEKHYSHSDILPELPGLEFIEP